MIGELHIQMMVFLGYKGMMFIEVAQNVDDIIGTDPHDIYKI